MSVGYDNAPQQENSDEVERKPMSKDLLEAVSTDEAFDTLYMVCSRLSLKQIPLLRQQSDNSCG